MIYEIPNKMNEHNFNLLGFQSHPSSISIVNICSFYTLYNTNNENCVDFQNLMKIEFCWRLIFEVVIIHKPSHGSCEIPHKIWARLDQSIWRLLNTNRRTDKKKSKMKIRFYLFLVSKEIFRKLIIVLFPFVWESKKTVNVRIKENMDPDKENS